MRSDCLKKPYTTGARSRRPSPSYPANDPACKGLEMKGNDGNIWYSVANKNNVYSWKQTKRGKAPQKKKVNKASKKKAVPKKAVWQEDLSESSDTEWFEELEDFVNMEKRKRTKKVAVKKVAVKKVAVKKVAVGLERLTVPELKARAKAKNFINYSNLRKPQLLALLRGKVPTKKRTPVKKTATPKKRAPVKKTATPKKRAPVKKTATPKKRAPAKSTRSKKLCGSYINKSNRKRNINKTERGSCYVMNNQRKVYLT